MPADALLARELVDTPRPTGAVEVNGQSWRRYAARVDETALVLTEPARTFIVIGRASDAELTRLAGSLR